jgi:aspartate/methionine/tyrosine aminotransferase
MPMRSFPSDRSGVAPFLAMQIAADAFARQSAGQDVALLCVGQPWGSAPAVAREAASAAIAREGLGYTAAAGTPALRRAIADRYRRVDGVEVDPGRIIVTTGSSAGFSLAFLTLFEAGDAVALGAPGYPPYRHILRALGCTVANVPTRAEDGFQLTLDALAAMETAGTGMAAPLRGLILASPANPTGSVSRPEDLAGLRAIARARGMGLVMDEIYHGLIWSGEPRSILAQDGALDDPGLVVVNSFSKYFAMPGWRVGWMVVPEALVPVVDRLQQNLFICPPAIAQAAAVAACGPEAEPELEARRAVMRHNRALLLQSLPALGIQPATPAEGAFYVYADVSSLTGDSFEWCRRALDEAGVAITPGVDFDESNGSRFVRLAYARQTSEIEAALGRLAAWRGRSDAGMPALPD